MRISKILLLLSIYLLLSAFNYKIDPRTKITKKWKFDIESMKEAMIQEMKKEQNQVEESSPEAFEGMIETMLNVMKDITMDFKKDGTLEISFNGQNFQGTWEISADGKNLTTKSQGKETTVEIKEINDKRLILKDKKGSEQALVPAE